MVDFNYESLDELLRSNVEHYDVQEMIDLMKIYFNDKTKLEPRINGVKKDELIYEIIERFKKMNKICKEDYKIKPILKEPINKKDVPNLIYNFFEYTMDFNNPNSKYMSKKIWEFDEEWFCEERVCYICENCGKNMEFPVEIVNEKKEKEGHIGFRCDCGKIIFPTFIRDKNRKVIIKD